MSAATTNHKRRTEEIITAAARVFNERGYHRTTMEEIAQKVGMLKGSLYYYFKSKEELLFSVIEEPMRRLTANLERIAAGEGSSADKVRQGILNHIQVTADYYPNLFVIAQERHEFLREQYRDRILDMHRRYRERWEQIVAEGVRRGEFVAGLDVSVAVFGLLGMCNWMYRWYSPEGRLDQRQVAEVFATILLEGMRAKEG